MRAMRDGEESLLASRKKTVECDDDEAKIVNRDATVIIDIELPDLIEWLRESIHGIQEKISGLFLDDHLILIRIRKCFDPVSI